MPHELIYQRLTEELSDVFHDVTLVGRPDLTTDQVAGGDSLAHQRVIFTVEKSFGVKFAASQIVGLKDVGELADLISLFSPVERQTSRRPSVAFPDCCLRRGRPVGNERSRRPGIQKRLQRWPVLA